MMYQKVHNIQEFTCTKNLHIPKVATKMTYIEKEFRILMSNCLSLKFVKKNKLIFVKCKLTFIYEPLQEPKGIEKGSSFPTVEYIPPIYW